MKIIFFGDSITDAGRKRIDDFKTEWEEILSIYRFVTKGDDANA